MDDLVVRPATVADRQPVVAALTASWGGTTVVAHGTRYDAASLPALVAERGGEYGIELHDELTVELRLP